jgi:hypothetical protein
VSVPGEAEGGSWMNRGELENEYSWQFNDSFFWLREGRGLLR